MGDTANVIWAHLQHRVENVPKSPLIRCPEERRLITVCKKDDLA
jgi:hypothetical protein